MTEREWLDIGYDKGIIELNKEEEVTFRDAYKKWFVMKMGFNRPPTMDRIEVTYNRYYAPEPPFDKCISKITDSVCYFLGVTPRKKARRCLAFWNAFYLLQL